MSKNNVVSLADKRKDKAEEVAEDHLNGESNDMDPAEYLKQHPELVEKIKEESQRSHELVEDLLKRIEKLLTDFSQEQDLSLDVTIPIEALTAMTHFIGSDLDHLVEKDDLESRYDTRLELFEMVRDSITNYIITKPERSVLSHDIYVALAQVLFMYIHQHRGHTIYERLKGEQNGAGTESVTE